MVGLTKVDEYNSLVNQLRTVESNILSKRLEIKNYIIDVFETLLNETDLMIFSLNIFKIVDEDGSYTMVKFKIKENNNDTSIMCSSKIKPIRSLTEEEMELLKTTFICEKIEFKYNMFYLTNPRGI